MSTIYFTAEHEWLEVEGVIGTCGITEFAQEQLGAIVYVVFPDAGRQVAQNDEIAVIESVKAASEIYAPVSGEVIEANEDLADNPAQVNEDAMGEGWFFKLRISDATELRNLVDRDVYADLIAGQN